MIDRNDFKKMTTAIEVVLIFAMIVVLHFVT